MVSSPRLAAMPCANKSWMCRMEQEMGGSQKISWSLLRALDYLNIDFSFTVPSSLGVSAVTW